MRLILASTSPRRREILALLGLPFEVIDPEFNEMVSEHVSMKDEVLDFAAGKARSVAKKHARSIVIGSDTMIFLNGEKIGKPGDIDGARRILRLLADKIHRIFTSVVILDSAGGPGPIRREPIRFKAKVVSSSLQYAATILPPWACRSSRSPIILGAAACPSTWTSTSYTRTKLS